jgi:hypothetical protein
MKHAILFLLLFSSLCVFGQDKIARITGIVKDGANEQPIDFVSIYVKGTNIATSTAENGRYSLDIPSDQDLVVVFTRVGYKESPVIVKALPARSTRQIDIQLAPAESNLEIVVKIGRLESGGMIREEVESLKILPSTTGNLESILPSIALGVSSGTGGELSSQYNVRGGNYDENLVYVNDFEIYRPQLIRAGQQEGLSFPNIDLIRDLSFSSGGFEARYGDKMSSVLDIKYKRPDSTKASISASLLGATAHIEGSTKLGGDKFRRFRYLVGTRYKTNAYLLGGLDIKGEYVPNFEDIQTYLTYDITRNLQLGLLANYNRSNYRFRPSTGSSAFGLVNYTLQLYTVFEGQEVDEFTTSMGGLSLTYLPDRKRNPVYLKLMASHFRSNENETFDIIGDYSLRQIESGLGSSQFGQVISELGTGTQHLYVRNFFNAAVSNFEHRGGIELQKTHLDSKITSSHFLQWSLKYQRENIADQINEWERLDSAGFSLPYDTSQLRLFSVLKTSNNLNSNRINGFFQDTYTFRNENIGELRISAGVRSTYWDLNKEPLFSPRAQILYKPLKGKSDISYRLAGGVYVQPPFYRELRAPNGVVNPNVLAQKSLHLVTGFTLDFYLGKVNPKKFRLITEAYYKKLWDLVSYDVENVRIRYAGTNNATGYVTGFDVRINGEFVPNAESWINLSFLRARESLDGVTHMERKIGQEAGVAVKDVPRPTDRLFNMSIFFQDYLPRNKNFRTHVNLNFGTGLPFGLRGNNEVYRNTYRFNTYNRVDIGFSMLLYNRDWKYKHPHHLLNFTKNSWVSLEVFNLLDVKNQAGNTWIKTVFQQQYAIPTYLTSRRINLRFRMDF